MVQAIQEWQELYLMSTLQVCMPKEPYTTLKRDLLVCQKSPIRHSEETHPKRALYDTQKTPTDIRVHAKKALYDTKKRLTDPIRHSKETY